MGAEEPVCRNTKVCYHSTRASCWIRYEKIFMLTFNSSPNDRILDWFKSKAFADNEMKLVRMMIFVFDRVENIMGN